MKHKLDVYPAILGRNDLPPVVLVAIPKIVSSQETGIQALKFSQMRITMRINDDES